MMDRQRRTEIAVFNRFSETCRGFAGRPVTCTPGPDPKRPPDYLCIDEAGKRIGVELGEWVNEQQIQDRKRVEAVENSFRGATRSREVQHPSHIGMVHFGLKDAARLATADASRFRDELYKLIDSLDAQWPPSDLRYNPRSYTHYDFSAHPTLAKYLHHIECIPVTVNDTPDGFEWIDFRPWGGAYSSESAVRALSELIAKKTAKYQTLHAEERLDELYLIAYFDQGLIYNSPYRTNGTGFEEIAALCHQWLAKNPGRFERVFLFDATDGNYMRVL